MIAQMKFVAAALGSFYGLSLFFIGLIISVALSLWMPNRSHYRRFVVFGSAPLASGFILPPFASGEASFTFALWWIIITVASTFGVGVLLGVLLAPVFGRALPSK